MGNNFIDIQYNIFLVNENVYCLWDYDIRKKTLEFLDSLNPEYFEYLADTIGPDAVDEDNQSASIAIRLAYSQALETFFTLLGACIQGPYCTPAWVNTYWPSELRELVRNISEREYVDSILRKKHLSWKIITNFIFTWLALDDQEKETQIKENFSKIWARFASDYLDENFNHEYNAIKHGLRIKPGGFYLAFGREDKPGVPAPKERMQQIGSSKYGSSFFVVERHRKKSHHIKLKRQHMNWNPEDFAWGLHILSMSIQNVISAIKILNDIPATEVRFSWPREEDTFSEPWKRRIKMGVYSMGGIDLILPDELIDPSSKEELLEKYIDGKSIGFRRIRLREKD